MRLTAILASHNRRESTLACLRSFYSQRLPLSEALDAVLVDDGSTDETASEVRRAFPETKVIRGSGDLYWASGMALAEQVAVSSDPDYLLWLNDDVILADDAVASLIYTEQTARPGRCIVVGALRDPLTGVLTYSGVRRRGFHPLRVEFVEPGDVPQVVDMFHGNVVLVSRPAYRAIGAIDAGFAHAQADLDYGLRAARLGIVSLLAPGTIATCTRDRDSPLWLDRSLSARQRLQSLFGPKGLPPRSAARYLSRHGGPLWPVFWIAPYVRVVASLLRVRLP
jgi:GT2 family glycosyltransferase